MPANLIRTTTSTSACSINRYYDPSTDQFLSVDPDVQETDQPYAFVNDDPLNVEDPLGLCVRTPSGGCYVPPKPKPKPTLTPKPKPTQLPSPTPTPPPTSTPTPTNEPSPTAAQTQAINDYINDTSKPWCYAGLGVAGSGAAGSELAVVYGANVDDPPAWLVTGFVIVNTLVVVTIIKVATEC
jgi:hypothetical protein